MCGRCVVPSADLVADGVHDCRGQCVAEGDDPAYTSHTVSNFMGQNEDICCRSVLVLSLFPGGELRSQLPLSLIIQCIKYRTCTYKHGCALLRHYIRCSASLTASECVRLGYCDGVYGSDARENV